LSSLYAISPCFFSSFLVRLRFSFALLRALHYIHQSVILFVTRELVQRWINPRDKSFRLRKSCGRPGQLSPRVNIMHYVTPPQSGKPRKWPPDTCGMVFEKVTLITS